MQTAINLSADGKHNSITAGPVLVVQDKCPNAPTTTCPACGGAVTLRKRQFLWNCLAIWIFQIARKRMDGEITYFYRHKHCTVRSSTVRGQGEDCPRRYQPT